MNLTASTEADQNQNLPTNYSPLELEKEMREFWTKNNIRNKLELLEKTAKGNLGYVEGPPTLNGIPHIGHARGRSWRLTPMRSARASSAEGHGPRGSTR